MKVLSYLCLALLLLFPLALPAQEESKPEAAPAKTAPAPSPRSESKGESAVPKFDPDSEVVTWNGQVWNIHNNSLVRSKMEKYLNEPEANEAADIEYQKTIGDILTKLSSANTSPKNVEEAWRLLYAAAAYPADAKLCDAIADAVYAVWLTRREDGRLGGANEALRKEIELLRMNMESNVDVGGLNARSSGKDGKPGGLSEEIQQKRQIRLQGFSERIAELEARYKANQVKQEGSEMESKIQYQALIVQLFFLRRFQHVTIATRFYRSIYGDGDTKLSVGDKAKDLFSKTSGVPPTITVIDTLANEATRDVQRGIESYLYLMEQGEVDSAIRRLTEAYAVGEHMPQIRTLSREEKRKGLKYFQTTNALMAALEVKDFDEASRLIAELKKMARDFVPTKALAAINNSSMASNMHLAKAQAALSSGNQEQFETELRLAAEVWPSNPKLKAMTETAFSQVDQQQKALADLERLVSQKNFRQIFVERMRFIAATAVAPEKQKELGEILEKMQQVEMVIVQANEISKRGDSSGAWETVECVYQTFKDDNKLNQLRADLTVRASEFVNCLQHAQNLEDRKEFGSSLAWYLRAHSLYPPSIFAQDGVDRISKIALPSLEKRTAAGKNGQVTEKAAGKNP